MQVDIEYCISTATTTYDFESELADKFRTSRAKKKPRLASLAKKKNTLSKSDVNLDEPLEYNNYSEEPHGGDDDDDENAYIKKYPYGTRDHPDFIPKSTRSKWNKLKFTEDDRNRWGNTAWDFVRSEEGQVFFSKLSYYDRPIDKHFMAFLLHDITVLKEGSTAWLNSDHIGTWINFLKEFGNSEFRDGKEVKWAILNEFHQSMMGDDSDDKHVDKGPVVVDACDDLVLTKKTRKFDDSLFGGDRPLWDVNYVYTPFSAHDHWYLAKLNMQTFHVTIYDSMLGYQEKLIKEQIRVNWSQQLYKLLNEIKFWENSRRNNPGTLNVTVEFDKTVPEQEGPAGDCGVMVCRNLEMLVRGLSLGGGGMSGKQIATEYRERMAKEIYKRRHKKGIDGGRDPAQVPQDNAQDPQDNAQDHQDNAEQEETRN